MPAKAHRPGPTRNHSRTSSGGASRLALNLHFTQKEPIQPKTEKAKRNGHVHEQSNGRTTSPFPRPNSAQRVHSREHASAAPKRAPLSQATTAQTKHKPGFTLASTTRGSDEDDDEWVSSESGAATPDHQTDSDAEEESVTTPQELTQAAAVLADEAAKGPSTPRATDSPFLPAAITNGSGAAKHQRIAPPSLTNTRPADPQPRIQTNPPKLLPAAPIIPATTTTPITPDTPTSPKGARRSSDSHKRATHARPPSAHSIHSISSARNEYGHPLRPHPLIRGQSFGHGHLAPLTITEDAAQAQLSSSPSPPRLRPSSSPTSIKTVSASHPSSVQTSPTRGSSRNNHRRPSTSSARSVATLPAHPIGQMSPIVNHDRTRTLSTASSSSSAAFSSLAHLPTSTRVAPPHLVVRFPPPKSSADLESFHQLLPLPYIPTHLTLLRYRNPIRESYDNVVRAKLRKRGS